MFLFLLTCLVTFIKMATINIQQSPTSLIKPIQKVTNRRYNSSTQCDLHKKCCCCCCVNELHSNAKENYHNNYMLHRYLNSKYQQQKVLKSLRGMSNHHPNQVHQSKNNLNKLSLPQSPQHHISASQLPHLKRPLSSVTTNLLSADKSQNGNLFLHLYNKPQNRIDKPPQLLFLDNYELNEESLKNNVQIVLRNLNKNYNALKELSLDDQQNVSNSIEFAAMSSSPESDCNSNPYYLQNTMMPIGCSIASSQDFTHDNSDYQWFIDYGYRDPSMQQHQSILSSLSASYSGIGELSYYEDLAKNIDANLAEVDMESFRAEDIHSLLTKLPTLCTENADNVKRNKMSLNDLDNSICKSELLFSPVKESHISVDSLDMEGYPDEGDIILTCKANKDNYTIAFEGSAMYSDDSFYDGPEYTNAMKLKQNSLNMNNLTNKLHVAPTMNTSMSKSEAGYTTWSKLRQSNTTLASKHSEEDVGDENNRIRIQKPFAMQRHLPHCFVNKSSSMPNLKTILSNQLQISDAISYSSVESYGNQRALLPHYPMPISTTSETDGHHQDIMHQSSGGNEPAQNAPSFNLVKLFIKQKSSSTDTCMDVSSGCWPSDSTNSSSDNTNNNNNNNNSNSNCGGVRMRKRSMNDSGKGSALSRHDEEDYRHEARIVEEDFQYDSLDATQVNQEEEVQENIKRTNTAVNSPLKRNHYKDLHFNIRNQIKHPALYNLMQQKQQALNNSINNNNNSNNNISYNKDTSHSDISRTSENLTQIFNINKSRTETMTKSIQTSLLFTGKEKQIQIVPPSFLAKLNDEMKNKKEKSSVFVVYPNYALPDLEFVKTQNDVILSPVCFKDTIAKMKRTRPVSLNDIDSIKSRQYGHVVDWKSLITLLPLEYRKILKNIPEANEVSVDASICSQKPIFSMTPPIRTSRGVTCDCAYILSNTNVTSSSSGGSSSQPPSSGYRGSSTILTDSDMNDAAGVNNMYVYQYENMTEQVPADRPPSGRMPKGILRRANTAKTPKSKRSSMFEGGDYVAMTTAEKRRSLQEPFYATHIIEDYIAEMEGHDSRFARKNLLPNYPKQREEYLDHRQSKMQSVDLHDVELNRLVSQKLTRNSVQDQANEHEARIRAEQFLISVPKSDLKHYAEIANILETVPEPGSELNSFHLRNEVSKALSSQRKVVQFTKPSAVPSPTKVTPTQRSPVNQRLLKPNELRFTTPPNSPNMSVTAGKYEGAKKQSPTTNASHKKDLEKEKQEKIQSNRFKRLQIQWELLSKDAAARQERLETKSGGNTPTNGAPKSRIPRPVSYPTAKAPENKNLKSPSRIVPPKKYNIPNVSAPTPTPTPRTPSKTPTTPKKTLSRPPAVRTR